MFGIISNFKSLYVADYFMDKKTTIKIVRSCNHKLIINGKITNPYVTDVMTGVSLLVTNEKCVKELKYYVNCFGLPRSFRYGMNKSKQKLVVSQVKRLKKLGKI